MGNASLLRLRIVDAGFTLAEVLVVLALTLLLTGSMLAVATGSISAGVAQPEAVDLQQRARAASDLLSHDLLIAGSGIDTGPRFGPLIRYFPPIVPRKMGLTNADPWTVARSDAITVMYVSDQMAQASVRNVLDVTGPLLTVNQFPSCAGMALCGLDAGASIAVFDRLGHFDFFTVEAETGSAATLRERRTDRSFAYAPGSAVAQAEFRSYYFDAARHQLRLYDGDQSDVPVVDDVVAVRFEDLGEPDPPTEPRPPLGASNCLYNVDGSPSGGLSVLPAEGQSLARLPLTLFQDGPWCGDGANRFDADLLRVRKVRVLLRLQAGPDFVRGQSPDFAVSGPSTNAGNLVRDYTVQFAIAPRNLNLGR